MLFIPGPLIDDQSGRRNVRIRLPARESHEAPAAAVPGAAAAGVAAEAAGAAAGDAADANDILEGILRYGG